MRSLAYGFLAGLGAGSAALGCGLDWTLPTNHFDGVNEQGYVSYWEKIAEADLGDGLVIPIAINFNSHRESSSPTLGKGWMMTLLESHVEPIDENTMKVIMPHGWNYYFLRTPNTETWGGNAGWVGQTDGSRFTITAPCGWRVKFDGGKIQEIDSPQSRTITIKYNGPVATEADIDNKPFLQVESDTVTGVAQDLIIAGQKITIAQDQRPRIQSVNNQNLITGFDPSLSQLQYPDGKTETFSFATPKDLTPTLAITQPNQSPRTFTWDPTTSQIKTDGGWTYQISNSDSPGLTRTNGQGGSEFYSSQPGVTTEQGLDGVKTITAIFAGGGPLANKIRKITKYRAEKEIYSQSFSYDEQGKLIRSSDSNKATSEYSYDSQGRLTQIKTGGLVQLSKVFDQAGRISSIIENGEKIKVTYSDDKAAMAEYLKLLGPFHADCEKSLMRVEDSTFENGMQQITFYSLNNKTAAILSGNTLKEFVYSPDNRACRIYSNKVLLQKKILDSIGRTVRETDFASDGITTLQTRTFEYDSAGQLVHETIKAISSTNDAEWTFKYDDFGNVTKQNAKI